MSLIKLEEVTMTYGSGNTKVNALQDVTLEVLEGDFVAIMGKSGCGKSTLLNILGIITKPKAGKYLLEEKDVSKTTASEAARIRNEKIGFVVQHFALIKELTVKENVGLPLFYQSCKKKEIEKRVDEVLKMLELEEKKNCYPNQLSGGQCQRVAIARALITKPKVILADEPTGALDEENGKNILDIFTELNKKGTTIVLVTHDKEIAMRCKRIVQLKDGRIVN